MTGGIQRIQYAVTGIVQGVGFRPFLHRLARETGVTGFARNTGHGVSGEAQGDAQAVGVFLAGLTDPRRLPPLAVVREMTHQAIAPVPGETGFAICASAADGRETLISPDIGMCEDCRRELFDPADRRYRYPFINCTNCGPRFTIVRRVPYDRASTTMARFAMCADCAREYGDIEDRRYHAQPDCCSGCGPRLWYAGADGNEQPGDAIAQAQALLMRGGVLAVKGLGGFHLACLPDEAASSMLRARKHRDEKPFALMCRDMDAVRRICIAGAEEEQALLGPRKPIVLLRKRQRGSLTWLSDNEDIGVMLPYTPLHALLMDGEADTLVMTSANPSALPAVISNDEAVASLHGIADGYLLHDREIEARCDDSVLRIADDGRGMAEYFIRRSRGYAPQPVHIDFDCTGVLALGAEQKASFALGKGQDVFYSQHIGDLKNAETLAHYEDQIARYMSLFGIEPKRVVCDLHPDYLSSRYAGRTGLPVLRVQHHHAHMLSCMADNGLDGECIGVIWDGTGLGEDQTIWGGEFLIGGYGGVSRAASMRPILLPGGDAAIRQISRIGDSLLWDAGLPGASPLTAAMLDKRINCPPSSGMGRLFDGVYALLTGRRDVTYEGQGAVLLEALACGAQDEAGSLPVQLYTDESGVLRLDTRPMIRALVSLRDGGAESARLAMMFHRTLIGAAVQICVQLRGRTGLDRVVLSGGVFFNQILLRGLSSALRDQGFGVYIHHRVSTSDEGIALGQLAAACSGGQDA
ncbi:MAG: carbamoyltransferase HypF [Clostridia bacterium]|nr:carbamoyltransferase HypF [Clostridia bacterium]